MTRRLIALLGVLGVLLLTITSPAAAQNYAVTDLGDLGGGVAIALDINASGQVAGSSVTGPPAEAHAFLWLPSPAYGLPAGMHDLGTLGGTYSEALGINASGQVVGRAFLAGDAAYHAVLWPAEGGAIDLGTLGGKNSQAFDINDSGEVVGWSDTAANTRHAFSWRDSNGNGVSDPGEMVDLGHLGGGQSIAYGINASGQIVGTSSTVDFASHAFRTTADGVIQADSDLGTLGGFSSTAYRINEVGMVAGHSIVFGNVANHAFRTAANRPIDPDTDGLGTLGGTRSEAWGINAAGHAVGWSSVSGSVAHKAFFSSGSGIVDLNTLIDPALGWILNAAFAINDAGQIVGSGGGPDGGSRAFLLTPPASDATPPVITPIISGTLGANGWYVGDVSFYWDVRDDESPVTTTTGCEGGSVTSDTAGATFTCTATSAGGTASGSVTIRRDATPPLIVLAADIIVEAAGPGGATVTYAALAVDNLDPSPVLACAPASGSVFPVGTTVVNCTASDAAGNSSAASFTVHVRGAVEQIVSLINKTRLYLDLPLLEAALATRLEEAAAALLKRSPVAACRALNLYIAAVTRMPSRQLSTAEKSELIADADRIKAVIGCR